MMVALADALAVAVNVAPGDVTLLHVRDSSGAMAVTGVTGSGARRQLGESASSASTSVTGSGAIRPPQSGELPTSTSVLFVQQQQQQWRQRRFHRVRGGHAGVTATALNGVDEGAIVSAQVLDWDSLLSETAADAEAAEAATGGATSSGGRWTVVLQRIRDCFLISLGYPRSSGSSDTGLGAFATAAAESSQVGNPALADSLSKSSGHDENNRRDESGSSHNENSSSSGSTMRLVHSHARALVVNSTNSSSSTPSNNATLTSSPTTTSTSSHTASFTPSATVTPTPSLSLSPTPVLLSAVQVEFSVLNVTRGGAGAVVVPGVLSAALGNVNRTAAAFAPFLRTYAAAAGVSLSALPVLPSVVLSAPGGPPPFVDTTAAFRAGVAVAIVFGVLAVLGIVLAGVWLTQTRDGVAWRHAAQARLTGRKPSPTPAPSSSRSRRGGGGGGDDLGGDDYDSGNGGGGGGRDGGDGIIAESDEEDGGGGDHDYSASKRRRRKRRDERGSSLQPTSMDNAEGIPQDDEEGGGGSYAATALHAKKKSRAGATPMAPPPPSSSVADDDYDEVNGGDYTRGRGSNAKSVGRGGSSSSSAAGGNDDPDALDGSSDGAARGARRHDNLDVYNSRKATGGTREMPGYRSTDVILAKRGHGSRSKGRRSNAAQDEAEG